MSHVIYSKLCYYEPCYTDVEIWASSWDYGTYHIGNQRRLRRASASAQSGQSFRCSYTWSMEVDQKSDIYRHWTTARVHLKNKFTEDKKYRNLMRWLIYSFDMEYMAVFACLTWVWIIDVFIANFYFQLKTLLHCCCRRKKFLFGLNKMIGPVMLLSLRENHAAMEVCPNSLLLNKMIGPVMLLSLRENHSVMEVCPSSLLLNKVIGPVMLLSQRENHSAMEVCPSSLLLNKMIGPVMLLSLRERITQLWRYVLVLCY